MSKRERKTPLQWLKNFVVYNWWTMSILYISGILIIFYAHSDLSDDNKKTHTLIRSFVKSVVLLSPDGRSVSVEREKVSITMEAFKNSIKRLLANSLIVDLKKISKNYTIKVIKDEEMIFTNAKTLNFFSMHYLANEPFAKKRFLQYLSYLLKSINKDTLPEEITVYKAVVKEYTTKENTFTINLTIYCDVRAYYIEDAQWRTTRSKITLAARGEYNFKNSTKENPLGIKIAAFTVPVIDKRNLKKGGKK